MKRITRPLLAAVLTVLSASCATQRASTVQSDPFQTFYSSTGYEKFTRLTDSTVTPPVNYQEVTKENSNRILVMLVQQGYVPIGTSNFQSPRGEPHRAAAAEMGRKVGASLVLYEMQPVGAGQYNHTVTYLAKKK
jgi:ABC-type Fe3+-hydroxamate transport system substrate-binding protein